MGMMYEYDLPEQLALFDHIGESLANEIERWGNVDSD